MPLKPVLALACVIALMSVVVVAVHHAEIPAVALAIRLLNLPLELGLDEKDLVLLVLAFLVSTITLGTGRTNSMQRAVHLVIFSAACLFLTLVP